MTHPTQSPQSPARDTTHLSLTHLLRLSGSLWVLFTLGCVADPAIPCAGGACEAMAENTPAAQDMFPSASSTAGSLDDEAPVVVAPSGDKDAASAQTMAAGSPGNVNEDNDEDNDEEEDAQEQTTAPSTPSAPEPDQLPAVGPSDEAREETSDASSNPPPAGPSTASGTNVCQPTARSSDMVQLPGGITVHKITGGIEVVDRNGNSYYLSGASIRIAVETLQIDGQILTTPSGCTWDLSAWL